MKKLRLKSLLADLKESAYRYKYDIAAVSSFVMIHLIVFVLWPVGGYGYDSGEYLKMMDLGFFADLHPNGYSLLLKLVRIFSGSPAAPYAFNHLVSIGTSVLLYAIVRMAFSRWVSVLWVLGYTLCTRAILWDCWLLTESTYLFILALQIWLVRRRDGVLALGTVATIGMGLLIGASFLIRTASIFAVPALLFPRSIIFTDESRKSLIAYGKKIGIVIVAALLIVLPDLFWYKAKLGTFSMTQSGPWNLLYGHADTARCRPSPKQPAYVREFCEAFQNTPVHVREFGLAYQHGRPGWKLIQRFGSFREAGPYLMKIMVSRIAERPFTYLAESIKNIGSWLTRSDSWYLPKGKGQFVHDPAIDSILKKQFPGDIKPSPDRSGWTWLLTSFRIPRVVFMAVWLVLISWVCYRRIWPHHLHLLVIFYVAGTMLVAFGEPRYFAPIEMSVFCIIPLELASLKIRRQNN